MIKWTATATMTWGDTIGPTKQEHASPAAALKALLEHNHMKPEDVVTFAIDRVKEIDG